MKTKLFLLIAIVVYSFSPVYANQDKNNVTCYEKEHSLKTAKNDVKTGYFILVKKSGKTATLKTGSTTDAEKFIHSFYPEFCEDIEYQLQFSPYYLISSYCKEIYIEKKRITRSGKYKRLKKGLYLNN